MPFLVASFLLVGTLVLGVVSVQALVAQTSFRMRELSRRSAELQQGYGRLKLEVAQLSAPSRIAKEARRLGYRLGDDSHTLTLKGSVASAQSSSSDDQPSFAMKPVLEARP